MFSCKDCQTVGSSCVILYSPLWSDQVLYLLLSIWGVSVWLGVGVCICGVCVCMWNVCVGSVLCVSVWVMWVSVYMGGV